MCVYVYKILRLLARARTSADGIVLRTRSTADRAASTGFHSRFGIPSASCSGGEKKKEKNSLLSPAPGFGSMCTFASHRALPCSVSLVLLLSLFLCLKSHVARESASSYGKIDWRRWRVNNRIEPRRSRLRRGSRNEGTRTIIEIIFTYVSH